MIGSFLLSFDEVCFSSCIYFFMLTVDFVLCNSSCRRFLGCSAPLKFTYHFRIGIYLLFQFSWDGGCVRNGRYLSIQVGCRPLSCDEQWCVNAGCQLWLSACYVIWLSGVLDHWSGGCEHELYSKFCVSSLLYCLDDLFCRMVDGGFWRCFHADVCDLKSDPTLCLFQSNHLESYL